VTLREYLCRKLKPVVLLQILTVLVICSLKWVRYVVSNPNRCMSSSREFCADIGVSEEVCCLTLTRWDW